MSITVEKKGTRTAEEKRDQIVKRSVELQERATEVFKRTNLLHDRIADEIKSLKKENICFLKVLTKKFNDQSQVLLEVARVAQSTEDTLLNVLLAIRQNEYLQANYPEQHGYPEMKVVGSHPAKTNPLT